MLRNYLTIAYRNLRRQKGYSFINTTGLAVGIACCVLIFLFVRSELSVNTVFEDVDRIYRVDSNWQEEDAGLPFATLAAASTSVSSIVVLLSKDFLELVLIAFLIAAPIAYFAMLEWLQDFAYRIDLGPWLFIGIGGLAMFIALVTVSWQAVRAALSDPVEALRSE